MLFVVAPERFRDEELLEPRRLLEARGAAVTVVSTRPGMATGMLGAAVPIANTVRQIDAGDYDALVVAGGSGAPAHLWGSDPLLALVRSFHRTGKPVAAICLAGAVLARAGVLHGRRATVFPATRAILELKRGGAAYVEDAVVVDGTLVTADGPAAAAAFGSTLLRMLAP